MYEQIYYLKCIFFAYAILGALKEVTLHSSATKHYLIRVQLSII